MGHPGDATLDPGTEVSGYEILRVLDRGGMGTVYAGREPTIGTRVAIKVLHTSLTTDATFLARFEREARTVNDVRHPALVEVFAYGRLEDGRPYLVMPLLEGHTLREELTRRSRLPPVEAWSIVREISAAVVSLHEAGIVHRDLKPENIFLESFGAVTRGRLLDLGIAKVTKPSHLIEANGKLTRTGTPIGTPIYMAPEQWWGTEIDGRVDQYSLGVSLYELVAGHPPFESAQFMELGQKHLHEAPPSLRLREPSVPTSVDAFIIRALAKSPQERFPSMAAFIEAGDQAFSASASSRTNVDDFTHPKPDQSAVEKRERTPSKLAGATEPVGPDPLARSSVESETSSSADLGERAGERRGLSGLAIVVGGAALLLAVGFAGASRRRAARWFIEGGWPISVIAVLVVTGILLLLWERVPRGSALLRWAPLSLCAAVGAAGTYIGFERVATVERMESVEQFAILNTGMYEVELSRFLGYFGASVLLLLVAWRNGVSPPKHIDPAARRTSWGFVGVLSLLSFGAALAGAPSASLIATVAAVAVAIDAIHPLDANDDAGWLERKLATTLAVAFASAAGLARIDARAAASWREQPSRAARVEELLRTADERNLTFTLGCAAVAMFVLSQFVLSKGAEFGRWRRAWRFVEWRGEVLLIALTILVTLGVDLQERDRARTLRIRIGDNFSSQFALFADLNPPSIGDRAPEGYLPEFATAVQLGGTLIAIDGKPFALLEQSFTEAGIIDLGRALRETFARHAASGHEAARLSLTVDERVSWRTVETLLAIARAAGAKEVGVLLTRGDRPQIPPGAPPEASFIVASDFVALPLSYFEENIPKHSEASFGELTPTVLDSIDWSRGAAATR